MFGKRHVRYCWATWLLVDGKDVRDDDDDGNGYRQGQVTTIMMDF